MAAPLTLKITWQRLVDPQGATCDRCQATETAVAEAADALRQAFKGTPICVEVEKLALDPAEFQKSSLESNRIWLAGRPLEEWLPLRVGSSPCCGPCGDAPCRTVSLAGQVYEAIPADLIVAAGLRAAAALRAGRAESRSQGASR